jgi:hypothetical protein
MRSEVPKGIVGTVLVIELRCVSVDDGRTDDTSASASPPGPAGSWFVATVPTRGRVTWLTVVGSDGVLCNTALTVEETEALFGPGTTFTGAPTTSEPRFVTVAAPPVAPPRPVALGTLGTGTGEASAALEKAAVRAMPTTTPATPPPRRKALRNTLR